MSVPVTLSLSLSFFFFVLWFLFLPPSPLASLYLLLLQLLVYYPLLCGRVYVSPKCLLFLFLLALPTLSVGVDSDLLDTFLSSGTVGPGVAEEGPPDS